MFYATRPPPPTSPPFPYTTLFRSHPIGEPAEWHLHHRISPEESAQDHAHHRGVDTELVPDGGSCDGQIGAIDVVDRIRRSEEHTSELQSLRHLVCRLLLEKKKKQR